jgi:formamidopyrimidine-DNA glycosylase
VESLADRTPFHTAGGWLALPELPEVEHLRQTLAPVLVGARVLRVRLARHDIVRPVSPTRSARVSSRDLLGADVIERLERHGKNLAIIGKSGRVVGVHLGMSGQLRFVPKGEALNRNDHVHCTWWLKTTATEGRMIFRDPRRFGGLFPAHSLDQLKQQRWNQLGTDALTIKPADLFERLHRRNRPIKAALLDQALIAGVGNIYADEALFVARIHPQMPCVRLSRSNCERLTNAIQRVMLQAIGSGGSTIRSYIDSDGRGGTYASKHQVYGRNGKPCLRCESTLKSMAVAQRTTVFCPKCQEQGR